MGAKSGTKSSKKAGVVKKTAAIKSPKPSKKTVIKSSKPSKTTNFADTALDSILVDKAVNAVLKYQEKVTEASSDKLTLLGNDRPVQVQFTLLRAPGESKPKPYQLLVPHPFFKLADTGDEDSDDVEEPEICLIVKEESKPWCLEMIEKFPDHMGCVKKVLTLDSLRKKHQSFEQKRQLLSKYNVFMADDRILPMMSKALGKPFIKSKKLPIPLDLTREAALPFAIQKALSATYMTVNKGTCISIRAGHTGMEPKKLAANIMAIAKSAAKRIPRSWANIQMIGVKTADSISLPVYNKTPEALREIAKLAGIKADSGISSEAKNEKEGTEESDKKETKEKKKDLKSPLLQALKKQKKVEEDKKPAKKAKKETKPENDKTPEKKGKRSTSPKPSSSTKKKQKKEEKPVIVENKDFIAAKKFKGSKKGYAFMMGKQGVGYYVDKKPVVDKMKMDAILRMAAGRSKGGKKNSKQRGRRR
mmetsp:Transcript_7450/g.16844  ORF Transcript_7450/g.16844 Transcript_7450/m.16844 type:complete len:475 (-) Transcript_7450:2053-3477(-)